MIVLVRTELGRVDEDACKGRTGAGCNLFCTGYEGKMPLMQRAHGRDKGERAREAADKALQVSGRMDEAHWTSEHAQ